MVDLFVGKVEEILNAVSQGPIATSPRNAIRRRIREIVYLLLPVKGITRQGASVEAEGFAGCQSDTMCNLEEIGRALGIAELGGLTACRVTELGKAGDKALLEIQPVQPAEELTSKIQRLFSSEKASATVLPLRNPSVTVFVPVQTEDLSASGFRIVSPVGFSAGAGITLDLDRILRHLFSERESVRVACKVARLARLEGKFDMGLRFGDAPQDFVQEILNWSVGEENQYFSPAPEDRSGAGAGSNAAPPA